MNVAMVMTHGNGEVIQQSQIDPLRSTTSSELTLELRHCSKGTQFTHRLAKGTADQPVASCVYLYRNFRKVENRKQQIGDCHVYNQNVDWCSRSFRPIDNYSNEGIRSQRHNKQQTVG